MILDANAQSAVVAIGFPPTFLSFPLAVVPPRVIADLSAAGDTRRTVTGSVAAVRRITGSVELLS